MHRSSIRRMAALVIFLVLAATISIGALVGGWTFDMPGGGADEPTSPAMVFTPESAPVQLPPFFSDDPDAPQPAPASPGAATTPIAAGEDDRPPS